MTQIDPFPKRRAARAILSVEEKLALGPPPPWNYQVQPDEPRFATTGLTREERELRAAKLLDARERRNIPVGEFELRALSGGGLRLTGYASVFNHRYEVMGGPPWGWTESVDQKAFNRTLREKADVHLLLNHEGLPLARTKSGTLKLAADQTGLHVSSDLDVRDPDVRSLEVKMERGDIDEMSIGFFTKADEWNDENTERRLLEVSLHKGDVSVVNFGANPATSASIN